MNIKEIISVEKIKFFGFFQKYNEVIDDGLLGSGQFADVRSITLKEIKRKALKVYKSKVDENFLIFLKLKHQFLKMIGIPTFDSYHLINKIVHSDGTISKGLLMENLYDTTFLILASDTFKKYKNGSNEIQSVIKKINKEKLKIQIERIVKKATFYGIKLAPDAMFILVDRDGNCRPIIADLDAINMFESKKNVQSYNLSLIADFLAYVDHSTSDNLTVGQMKTLDDD